MNKLFIIGVFLFSFNVFANQARIDAIRDFDHAAALAGSFNSALAKKKILKGDTALLILIESKVAEVEAFKTKQDGEELELEQTRAAIKNISDPTVRKALRRIFKDLYFKRN